MAKKKAAAQAKKMVSIKLVKSAIGFNRNQAAVVEGMGVRSFEGAWRASLHGIVDLTMRIWDVD